MIKFSLASFIKICLLDTGGRVSEIQKKISGPGGYDFYKPLQNAIRARCLGQESKANDILEAPFNDAERRHNRAAFECYDRRFGRSGSFCDLGSPRLLKFPVAGISVSVDPLFEVVTLNSRDVYCIWPNKSPKLSQKYGAMACYIMRRALAASSLANCAFFFVDLSANRAYSEKQITNSTNLMLMADVNSIATLINELK